MPRLLELALECDEYRALPYSGGVMDQPAGLIKKLRKVSNVYLAVKAYETEGKRPGESAKWKTENEETWNIVSQINELREKYG